MKNIKYQPQRLDKVLRKYSKRSRSVGEIEEEYNQISKYSTRKRSDEEVKDQYLNSIWEKLLMNE